MIVEITESRSSEGRAERGQLTDLPPRNFVIAGGIYMALLEVSLTGKAS
jgi:hypothetical protein